MLKKYFVALLLTAVFGAIFPLASSATVPDEQYVVQGPPTPERSTGLYLEDTQLNRNTFTYLEARTADGTSMSSRLLTRTVCKKVGDPGCESDKYFQFSTQFQYCNSVLTSDCVSSVFARDKNGNLVEGKYVEDFPGDTSLSYTGDPLLNLPSGGSTFIVDFPTLPHQGGTQYLVVASVTGSKGFEASKFSLEGFNSGIFAISKINGQFTPAQPETTSDIRPDHVVGGFQYKGGNWGTYNGVTGQTPCVQTLPSLCLVSWPLALDVEFGLSMKLRTTLTGWIHGRITDISVDISTATDGDQLVTVKGKPSIIPGIAAWFPKSRYPQSLAMQYKDDPNVDTLGIGWPSLAGVGNSEDGLPYSILKTKIGYNESSFKETLAWIDAISDKASIAPTVWSFRSIESGSEFSRCTEDKKSLTGFVTTNASMYVASPPTFNSDDQTLDYKVVAPHYLPDGTEFKGMYNLVINSGVARCIYGFSSAPVSATISIISSDGAAQVASTVIGERNGWLYLSANNFTFSAPIVKVKLSQDSKTGTTDQPTVKPNQGNTVANKSPAKKMTIACVKGKTSRKITAISPKCPSGYKKNSR